MIPHSKKVNTVRIEQHKGRSSIGDVFADPVDYPALIEARQELVVNESGDEELSTATVHLDPIVVTTKARVTLHPGTDLEKTAKVIQVGQYRGMRLEHTVLRVR